MSQETSTISAHPASPWKRIFAWVYDLLPALGVYVLVFVIGYTLLALIVDTQDQNNLSENIRNHPLWIAYLITGTSYYYIWCWHKGGQTIGYRTWRLKLVDEGGQLLSWQACIIRAALSCGGLANLWSFFDTDNRGWHDIVVGAYLVELPRSAVKKEDKPLI